MDDVGDNAPESAFHFACYLDGGLGIVIIFQEDGMTKEADAADG